MSQSVKMFGNIITPHVFDVSGVIVFDTVCLSPLSWPNGQAYRLNFWYAGQMEGYLGQGRSRSYVKGHNVNNKTF